MVRKVSTRDRCTKKPELVQQRKSDSSPSVPQFIKIMVGENFPRILYIPPNFARTAMHLVGQKTQLEDVNGLRWSVTVRIIDGSLAFDRGWSKFFLDHGIEEGDLLVFNYVKESHFLVQIFGINCCPKIGFDIARPQPNKRRRVAMETDSEVDAVHSPRISSNTWPKSPISDTIIPDSKNGTAMLATENAKYGKQATMMAGFEDPICMMEIDRAHCHKEDRSFLLDLSKFEMEKEALVVIKEEAAYLIETSHADTCDKHLEVIAPSPIRTIENTILGVTETDSYQTQKIQEEATGLQMDAIHVDQISNPSSDIFTSKNEIASVVKASPVETDIREQSKLNRKDTNMYLNLVNQVAVNSVEISTSKFEKSSPQGTSPFDTDYQVKSEIKRHAAEAAARNNNGRFSGEFCSDKFEKAADIMAPSEIGIIQQYKIEEEDARMAERNENADYYCNVIGGMAADPIADHSETVISEHPMIKEDGNKMGATNQDGDSGAIFVDRRGKASWAEVGGTSIMQHSKLREHNTGTAMTSFEFSVDNFEKSLNKRKEPLHSEGAEQIEIKGGDTQIGLLHSEKSQFGGIVGNKFDKKPSICDSNNACQGMCEDGQKLKICSSKTAEMECGLKHRPLESSISGLVLNDPGKLMVKKELTEAGQNYYGEETRTERKHGHMFSPVVKVEPVVKIELGMKAGPDFPHADIVPLAGAHDFSAEVKTLSYLDLPLSIQPSAANPERNRRKVIYLRDPEGRVWPVLFANLLSAKALTTNWGNFCRQNNIMPGDVCSFLADGDGVYGVEITRKSHAPAGE